MKKGLKFGMLAVAFVAAMTAVVSTGKVEATTEDGLVQVTINAYNNGVNTCQLEDYLFTFDASTADQDQTTGHAITCQFGASAASTVTLQLSGDLKDGNKVISGENVTLRNNTWTADPEELGSGTTVNDDVLKNVTPLTLFNHVENKIGDATGANVEIKVNVPGGTPNGAYEGTLVLTF